MINRFVETLGSWVWGPPTLVLLMGTGLYLTFLLRGLQFRFLPRALYLAFVVRRESGAEGDVSHFQALMTALAATVGTGNIAGVATAIALGGPGALFWMWITALVGMATKYAEALLGVKYRRQGPDGTMNGGPMYYLTYGLGQKTLGIIFAVFASFAAFGIGDMVQAHSVADALHSSFGVAPWITGVILAVATAVVIIGGIQSIARVSTLLVPVMAAVYLVGGLVVLILNADRLPGVVALVIRSAFTGSAAAGGFGGAAVMMGIRYGVARGVFSNESGLGTAGFAAAAAQSSRPSLQALVSMTQTFLDTIVVCSMTGLVILVTDTWTLLSPSGRVLTGAPLTTAAFSAGLGGVWGEWVVAISLVLFAYSTLIGWAYYGEKSIFFLFGQRSILPYRLVFCAFAFLGTLTQLTTIWNVADVMNGLMALPNLIGVILLARVVRTESSELKRG